ncbi:MAG: ABC transporter ATP-binding protein [Janthinobacterium lividum]
MAPEGVACGFELSGAAVEAGGRTLLHPLDLVIGGAGIHGLIGHNGSGKTTLLRLLAGQQPPSRGQVRFGGRALRAWPHRAFARQLAYMPQNPPLDPALRVRDLVAMGRFPWHGTLGRVSDADRAAVLSAMQRTGVAAMADRPLGSLSGGERQRALIALCVAQGSRCLLLDEPTSALDVAHQMQVLSAVRALTLADGIGVVIVLHDINLAARFCDELIALRGGRLIARGSPAEIMSAPVLESIYGAPLGVVPHPGGRAPIAYLP